MGIWRVAIRWQHDHHAMHMQALILPLSCDDNYRREEELSEVEISCWRGKEAKFDQIAMDYCYYIRMRRSHGITRWYAYRETMTDILIAFRLCVLLLLI